VTFLIAHRGNCQGKNSERENDPSYLQEALDLGYHVEIDVWWHNDRFWLGHNKPTYPIDSHILWNPWKRVWCHAKNIEAATHLSKDHRIRWFWHENDKMTITSDGYIWSFPGVYINNSVVNQPEDIHALKKHNMNFVGVCADDFMDIDI